MSLIFSEDLSGGTSGNFGSETGGVVLGDGITFTGAAANLTIPVTDAATYLACTDSLVDDTPSVHFKFDFTLDTFTIASTNRLVALCSVFDATQLAMWMRLHDDDDDGVVDSLRVEYQRNGANFGQSFPITATLSDGVFTECRVFYQVQEVTADGGRIVIYIGDELVCDLNITDQFLARARADSIRFGNFTGGQSTNAAPVVLSIKNVKVAPTSAYNTTADTYYVDPVNGDDINPATEALPLKNAGPISFTMLSGEQLNLMTGVHRSINGVNGLIKPIAAGTATAKTTVTGNGTVTTCHGVGPSQVYEFNASATNGEYYVTLPSAADPSISDPAFIATGSESDTFDNLTRIFADGNTVGTLNAGEFAYGDNDTLGFNTVYYKPLTTENISTLRMEISTGNTGIEFDTNHTLVYGLETRMAGTGVRDSGSTAGSYILNCDCGYSQSYGILSNGGAAKIVGNAAHNSQSHVLGSGSEVGGGITNIGGSTSVTEGNWCYMNADDGMDVEGVGTDPKIYGNLLTDNGYNSTDGCGIEVASNVTGCDINNNTTSGNNNRGISIAANVALTMYNNLMTDEAIGLWLDTGVGGSITAATNAFFGNSTNVGGSGSGNYSSTGDVTTDPLLDSNYSPQSGSPLIGVGTRWWTGANPVGKDGEPFSDIDTDIGGIQSKLGPFHPVNL